jgi:hypothetical protein
VLNHVVCISARGLTTLLLISYPEPVTVFLGSMRYVTQVFILLHHVNSNVLFRMIKGLFVERSTLSLIKSVLIPVLTLLYNCLYLNDCHFFCMVQNLVH